MNNLEKIGKEYNDLAVFINKEILRSDSDDLTVAFAIIKKFAQGGWIWNRE